MSKPPTEIVRSARLHLWPIIGLNGTLSGFVADLNMIESLSFSLALCLLASFGFLLNDIVDRRIDIEVHPDRLATATPETLRIAHMVMWLALFLGLSISCIVGSSAALVAIVIAIALAAYSLMLRKQLLIATLVSACSITSPFWAPFIVAHTPIPIFQAAIIFVAFVLISARETILDMIDVRGDLLGERDTIATVMGEQMSVIVATILTIGGFLALVLACIWKASTLSPVAAIAILFGLVCFGWFTIGPTVRLATASHGEKRGLEAYVSQTRFAMALMPLFVIVAWLTRG